MWPTEKIARRAYAVKQIVVVAELESFESCGLVKCHPDLGVQGRKSHCHCLDEVPHELKPNEIRVCCKYMDS